jgi:hypothetical protein
MPKLRKAAHVRSMKSIAIKVGAKIGGRKSKVSVKGLSNATLLKEANHIIRPRDKNKIMTEINVRGLNTLVKSTETI